MEEDILVGKGLAGALQLLRQRGDLKNTTDWVGQNMDKKKSRLVGIVDEPNNVVGQRDIILDYIDEFGRKLDMHVEQMTPKEAFWQFYYKFYGKGPSKKKQAKRLKQYQLELKMKQVNKF